MMEMFDQVVKNFLKAIVKKKPVAVQENQEEVLPESELNELYENQDNQGEPIQLSRRE